MLALGLSLSLSFGARADFWAKSSLQAVEALGHPTPQERVDELGDRLAGGFQFVAYGDQRALADGEWQAMVGHIARIEASHDERPTLFVLDTGDIVQDGRFSDQFHQLRDLLTPLRRLPYLVSVGNHELANERDPLGRAHSSRFLARSVNDGFPASEEELHWEWSHGSLRIISLDSNAIVYRRPGEEKSAHRARAQAELRWLAERLADPEGERHTIVALHHPFLQTASKHRDSARDLWELEYEGRRLPDLLADGGVDLVLTGHTHSYEAFRLQRDDGRVLWQINLSGRPRGAFWGLGAWLRRVADIRGREKHWLARKGFDGLEGWTIEQRDLMREHERDQFAIFDVEANGAVSMQLYFVEKKEPHELSPGAMHELLPPLARN